MKLSDVIANLDIVGSGPCASYVVNALREEGLDELNAATREVGFLALEVSQAYLERDKLDALAAHLTKQRDDERARADRLEARLTDAQQAIARHAAQTEELTEGHRAVCREGAASIKDLLAQIGELRREVHSTRIGPVDAGARADLLEKENARLRAQWHRHIRATTAPETPYDARGLLKD